MCQAFGNFLGKFNLPYLALPFNMIIVISFLTIQPRVSDITTEINIPEIFDTTTINSNEVEDGEAGTTIFPESVTEQPVTNGTAPVGKFFFTN